MQKLEEEWLGGVKDKVGNFFQLRVINFSEFLSGDYCK